MAELVGVLLESAVSELSKAIKKTWYFKSQLSEMKERVERMRPYAKQLEKINKELDRPREETEGFMNLLKQAEELGQKCEKINWKFWKKTSYSSKLDEMNESLKNYLQGDLQLQNARNVAETLYEVKSWKKGTEEGSSSGWSSGVPSEKCIAIGLDDPLRELMPMLLKDSPEGDCSVVVVSGAGGSGKTTLVTKLCHDPQIKGRFRRHIYFVTVSRTYDKKVIIKNLLGELPGLTDEVAIQQWGSFLGKTTSEVLLVLDDVWSESVIKDFKFKSPGYKVLVTSRMTFSQFDTYPLLALNIQDATRLFRVSAFPENSNIPGDLVDKLVKCCKFHPLALSVIGSMLKGRRLASWEFTFEVLSEEKKSLMDLDESIKKCLEKSLDLFDKGTDMKKCYLDLGLFPEDQKIAATSLLDMWAHLYNHDDRGVATMDILDKLSSRNLAALQPRRKHSHVIANHCDEESVMQHDVMRDLAIYLNSQEPMEQRETLIINAYGQVLSQLPQTINARILSISTDDRFSLAWKEIQFPNVEVFVLNFMSKMHPLPQFVQHMKRLKVLIITNYGYSFSEIQNFPAPQCLSGLTRIRLDHLSISSISTAILMLETLQKLSLIMCKIGNSFNQVITNKLANLVEICIESCDDLVTFPAIFCYVDGLKKLSITNCHELTSLSEEFGKLANLEVLRLASCSKITTLPESMRKLKKLRIIDLSHCLNLRELPQYIGELGSLQTIDVTGCTGLALCELPISVKDFDKVKVVCDEEVSHLWSDFKNVKVEVVEEDALDTFYKIMPKGHNK